MFFTRVYDKGLAHASYFVGCQATGEALIIDPKRDVDEYLDIAESEGLRITHIAETHIHADFLSGSRELAAQTGAKVYLSDEGGPDWLYQFAHEGLRDGDTFMVGNLKIGVMHTPGHTPEHISFLLTDTPASSHPSMLFTGDFVFVGDIGRPDLLEKAAGIKGTRIAGAKQMFESLNKFKALPDHVQVWPAHGAGSACGKALGAVPNSTVGYEKLSNWALQIDDEDTFVEQLLAGQPEPPKYFAMMKKLNKTGPAILGDLPHPARLTIAQFEEARRNGLPIIDTRDKFSFAGGHIPGSINIQDNRAFSTWAGWILGYETPFILIAPAARVEELTRELIRIGLDHVKGYVADIEKLVESSHDFETLDQVTVDELKTNRERYAVLDVRGYTEFNSGHIPDAINIHAGYLADELERIPRDRTVVMHCASGDRSSIGASILRANGFTNIANLTGGFQEYAQRGLPVEMGEKNLESVLA